MKNRVLSLLLCFALLLPTLLSLGGCGSAAPEAPASAPPEAAEAAKAGSDAPDLPPAAMLAVSAAPDPAYAGEVSSAALGFAAGLLRRAEGENRLLSPVSVLCALGMTLAGAAGETRSQMEAALGVSSEALNAFLGPWLAALAGEEDAAFHAADGIWLTDDEDVHISEDFLRLNREAYGAAVERCAFDGETLKRINDFVRENTGGMIEKILDRIPDDAVMYLVNALSFDADWETVYRENQVRPGLFTAGDGTEQDGEFLASTERVWLSDGETVGFMKYYEGRRFAFAALLPPEGVSMDDYLASLTGERLTALLAGAAKAEVVTLTPKFEVSFDAQLRGILGDMGMTDAFDPDRADFSSLGCCSNGENLYISRVIHKTFLKLDEKGTKAGAATAVEMFTTSAAVGPREEPHRVILDRPFVYLLIDCETLLPLFIGTLNSLG